MQEIPFSKFIYGDSSRIFLNTELGCASSCSYCYLPSEGFPINAAKTDSLRITTHQLLDQIKRDERVIFGRNGTVFSIGCFSECWDSRNREETIALILGLLPYGNLIQLATKRRIDKSDLSLLVSSPDWQGQLFIFISSASITRWTEHEKGTTKPNLRFESFNACNETGVNVFLYIKPVIPGVTINDIKLYGELMEKYCIDAIVGDFFVRNEIGLKSPISNSLFVRTDSDVQEIRTALMAYGTVYSNSVESMNGRGHNEEQNN